jgi:hypothetical protein
MSISFVWSCDHKVVDPASWGLFCHPLTSLLQDCAAIPLADQFGHRIEGDGAFERSAPDGSPYGGMPVAVRINAVDEPGAEGCVLRLSELQGTYEANGPSAHLIHAALLVAAATLRGFTFATDCSEKEAGFGMAMARNALVKAFPGIGQVAVERFLFQFAGASECRDMDARASTYQPQRDKVRALLESIADKQPEGAFEEATVRTARAVLHRLELGVDGRFDADYSVHSLEGYFNQSNFLDPLPPACEPAPGM